MFQAENDTAIRNVQTRYRGTLDYLVIEKSEMNQNKRKQKEEFTVGVN